ncbi:MAG: glutaminase domain-containing protein, partial [Phycisphaerales bacterium]
DVGETEPFTILVGYDEGRAIEFFERPLRPYWQATKGEDFGARLIDAVAASKAHDVSREETFVAEAMRVGGPEYARLVKLAYRQVMAGHKIVADWDHSPLMFSKENTSNGCIGTVDVIYPACPFFLYHNPEMLKAQLKPLMDYAASPRWKFPFAPHDLGTYPKANGQVYGGGERTEENQMPVEESGNMIIMLAALAKVEGNAEFSLPYLPVIERWAQYLKEHGLDPANQLCTDDFAGHLARNANLSAKTCVALGAYAQVLKAAGREDDAARWRAVAEEFAAKWLRLAEGSEATVLVFGAEKPGTWSQKYNLVWDRALGMGLFPAEVFDREMAWYKTKMNKYGLPLDSRRTYTKTDWTVWSACLTRRRSDFDAIMRPVYEWSNASPPPTRVPLTDWYETTDGKTMGMYARTVVGGIWMPLMMEKMGAGLK